MWRILLGMALGIALGFYAGYGYGFERADNRGLPTVAEMACPMDAKLCPDGRYVGRKPPSCDFVDCP